MRCIYSNREFNLTLLIDSNIFAGSRHIIMTRIVRLKNIHGMAKYSKFIDWPLQTLNYARWHNTFALLLLAPHSVQFIHHQQKSRLIKICYWRRYEENCQKRKECTNECIASRTTQCVRIGAYIFIEGQTAREYRLLTNTGARPASRMNLSRNVIKLFYRRTSLNHTDCVDFRYNGKREAEAKRPSNEMARSICANAKRTPAKHRKSWKVEIGAFYYLSKLETKLSERKTKIIFRFF